MQVFFTIQNKTVVVIPQSITNKTNKVNVTL